jgi:pyruvate/2-oxoglutarate dehydrogenase complex dihydrolipoamide acyltransferase (E2) component
MIQGGTIVKWHKAEGDWVNFGDDLFDVRVEEVQVTRTIKAPDAGRWLEQLHQQVRKLKERPAAAGGPEGAAPPQSEAQTWDAVALLRVTSSDVGLLRKICAKEQEYQQVGDLLALLVTDEADPAEGGTDLAAAGVFRVVANLV